MGHTRFHTKIIQKGRLGNKTTDIYIYIYLAAILKIANRLYQKMKHMYQFWLLDPPKTK